MQRSPPLKKKERKKKDGKVRENDEKVGNNARTSLYKKRKENTKRERGKPGTRMGKTRGGRMGGGVEEWWRTKKIS